MNRLLVTIIDNKANDIVPQTHLWVHRAVATAVRMFQDASQDPKSMIHHHTEDFDLVQLGTINDKNEIHPAYEILITGKAMKAANEKPANKTAHDIREVR